jgi:hypothetical protein
MVLIWEKPQSHWLIHTGTHQRADLQAALARRWERLALAQRRGEAIPPIEVYRVGHRHFVSDGHHRVSIAAATGQRLIDAYVTQVLTTVPPQTETASPARCWR